MAQILYKNANGAFEGLYDIAITAENKIIILDKLASFNIILPEDANNEAIVAAIQSLAENQYNEGYINGTLVEKEIDETYTLRAYCYSNTSNVSQHIGYAYGRATLLKDGVEIGSVQTGNTRVDTGYASYPRDVANETSVTITVKG